MQEQIGKALIPYLQEVANYLNSPDGQRTLQGIVKEFVKIVKEVGKLITFLAKNIELIKLIITLVVGIKIGYFAVTTAVKLYTLATTQAAAATRALKYAIASTGVGLLVIAVGELASAFMSAGEDSKSQGQLALALRNTLGANDSVVASAEAFVAQTQRSVSVLDDELRPALASAVRATGSLSKGQDLLNLALDVSAGTGKSLDAVIKAIARAQNGQLGSLQRLIPTIKKGSDFTAELRKQFAGAAEAAANADPYKRLEVLS